MRCGETGFQPAERSSIRHPVGDVSGIAWKLVGARFSADADEHFGAQRCKGIVNPHNHRYPFDFG